MKKMFVFSAAILLLLLTSTFVAEYAQAGKKVAGVHIVHSDEDLEAKSRVLKLPYYMDAYLEDSGDTFLVLPATAGSKMEIFTITLDDDGKLHLGAKQSDLTVSNAGEGLVWRFPVSEGIPTMAMCFMGKDRKRECWIPRHSGKDGSLILDEGFYPVREKNKNESDKTYSQGTEPLLTGHELMNLPHMFVERLKDAQHLAYLAAKNRFEPKGELTLEMPHHFLFVPLELPTTVRLHIEKNRGGDSIMDPTPVASITLNDFDAAVFSLDLHALTDPDNPDENPTYLFVADNDTTGESYYWRPQINHKTGVFEGYGLGPVEEFAPWPY